MQSIVRRIIHPTFAVVLLTVYALCGAYLNTLVHNDVVILEITEADAEEISSEL